MKYKSSGKPEGKPDGGMGLVCMTVCMVGNVTAAEASHQFLHYINKNIPTISNPTIGQMVSHDHKYVLVFP